MTTPDQLRDIVRYLKSRVRLKAESEKNIAFEPPGPDQMVEAGLDRPTVVRLLASPWWPEMVDDILETAEFAEPSDPPERILSYARDVIEESIGKRFPLDD